MNKRWNILSGNDEKEKALNQSLKINTTLNKILVQRGIDDFEKSKAFFRPQLNDLHNPFLMKDMQKAVDRIIAAINKNEKILIFGDYDVDGTTSVACMYQFICKIHTPHLIDFYIPHRYREGYGISKAGIDFAATHDFSLIIALDCGIKSVDLISYAKDLGIDFIICDHHLPDIILPPAVAILNPKQTDCHYPFKDLCGCGACCCAIPRPWTTAMCACWLPTPRLRCLACAARPAFARCGCGCARAARPWPPW